MSNIRLSGISLEQIKLFLAAVETSSFTEAGQRMFLTQSAVSRKISALEHDVGLQLFSRERAKVRPTPAGEQMYRRLKDMVAQFESAVEAAAQTANDRMNTIAVGVLDPTLLDRLMDVIRDFRRACPKTAIRIETYELSELRRRMIEGSLDIIFTLHYEASSFSSLYASHMLDNDSMYVYMSSGHPLAGRGHITLDDLRHELFIIHDPALVPSYFRCLEELCAAHGFRPEIDRMVDNHNALYPALLQDRAVFVAGKSFGAGGFRNIRAFPLEDAVSGQLIVWRRDNPQMNLRAFIELCVTHLGTNGQALETEKP